MASSRAISIEKYAMHSESLPGPFSVATGTILRASALRRLDFGQRLAGTAGQTSAPERRQRMQMRFEIGGGKLIHLPRSDVPRFVRMMDEAFGAPSAIG